MEEMHSMGEKECCGLVCCLREESEQPSHYDAL